MKTLTLENSTTSEFDGYEYDDKGRYQVHCYEMLSKRGEWRRSFVIDEHKKRVYFSDKGCRRYYIRHNNQYIRLESLTVAGGCNVRNRKWCFTPN